jgi:hypothetical protein
MHARSSIRRKTVPIVLKAVGREGASSDHCTQAPPAPAHRRRWGRAAACVHALRPPDLARDTDTSVRQRGMDPLWARTPSADGMHAMALDGPRLAGGGLLRDRLMATANRIYGLMGTCTLAVWRFGRTL